MRVKYLTGIGVSALMAAGLALAGTTAPIAQDKTLAVGTWYWNQPVLGDWWRLVGEKFEKDNPGVKLDIRNLPVNDYMTQVVVELASGNPADVVSASVNLAEIKDSGGIVPLNDMIEKSGMRSRIEEACWTATTFDGQIFAVPIAGRTLTLLTNEKMLKDAGLTTPTTPEEFLEAARKLTVKDASGKVTQYGASMVHINEEPSYEMLMMWSIAFGGSLTDGSKPTVTDPGVVKALAYMKTLYDEELIPRGRSEDDQRALFAAGTSAMEIDETLAGAVRRQDQPRHRERHQGVARAMGRPGDRRTQRAARDRQHGEPGAGLEIHRNRRQPRDAVAVLQVRRHRAVRGGRDQ